MRARVPLLIVPVLIAIAAFSAGDAAAMKPGGGGHGGGGAPLPCDAAPGSAKGKVDKSYVKGTAKCLDILEDDLDTQILIINGAAGGCPSADASFNDQFGDSLIKQAESGLDQNKRIGKARTGYLKKAGEYQSEHGDKQLGGELEAAAEALGKALFDGSGVWTGTSGVGSALRNNDCDEAANKAAEAAKALKSFKASSKKAKEALGKIK